MQNIKNLTSGPIQRQLFHLALPVMGTSFIQMAYSFTDMAWVGGLGSKAVAAIGAVGILTWTTNSIALLNKVGSEVTVSQSIGMHDLERARSFAQHNLTLSIRIALVWTLLLFTLAPALIGLFGLSDDVSQLSTSYLHIVSMAFPFLFLSSAMTGIYNASGHTKVPFWINGTGLITNMVLDPVLIHLCHLGTNGAALATFLSQMLVCLLFVYMLKKRYPIFDRFQFFLRKLKPDYVRSIIRLGLPVSMLNTFFSLISLFLARIASAQGGHLGVMTLTAGGQLEALAWYTAQGFSTALSTFTAQNYAAQQFDRMRKGYLTTLQMITVFGVVCTIGFYFFGNEIFSLIVSEPEAYQAGGHYLRIDSFSMIFMPYEITTQGFFYGISRTVPPATISIVFNVMRIPLALLFAAFGMGISGLWWAISLSSILKGIAAGIWLHFIVKKIQPNKNHTVKHSLTV